MKARIRRTAIVVATTLVGYQLYSVIAVPLIEPAVSLAQREPPAAGPRSPARSFDNLFPPGAWERDRPKVLEIDQGTLLFDDYQSLPDGSIQLNRCTLVCSLDGPVSPQGSARPIIMRSESGATIYFDAPLDLLGGHMGRVIGGRLAGEITIASPPSAAGAGDDLLLVTRNVRIDEQRIWTPHPVRFRYGRSSGSGRDLSIELQPPAEKNRVQPEPAAVAGRVKSLELVHVERVEIYAGGDLFQLPQGGASGKAHVAPGAPGPEMPLEVRCQGPFRFDFQRHLASLEKRVDVIRHNTDGPSDQLNCELLEMHFQPAETAPAPATDRTSAPPTPPAAGGALQLSRIVAVGYPAIVRAASRGAEARADRIEYEFASRRVWMKDRDKLVLSGESFQAEAPELEYEIPPAGGLGRLWASGPGVIRGRRGTDARPFVLHWSEEVRLVPHDDVHVLSLRNSAAISAEQLGGLAAHEIHLYLRQRPDPARPGSAQIEIDRMKATRQVQIHSARFSGTLDEASVWFRAAVPPAPSGDATQATQQLAERRQVAEDPAAQTGPGIESKFHLEGQVLHAQVALGETAQLQRMSVSGQVALDETLTGSEPPSRFAGDRLELESSPTGQLWAQLGGQPASASLRGLTLVGPRITISQRENTVQIVGPGTMTLPAAARDRNAAAGVPPVQISWAGGMRFDGLTGQFERTVSARGGHQTGKGETLQFSASSEMLDVILTRRVNFKQAPQDREVDIRELRFEDWVFMENEMFDALGSRKSHDQMQLRNLVIDQQTGHLQGAGPGWIVHRGQRARSGNGRQSLISLGPRAAELSFLRVDFEREMIGNLHTRDVQFSHRTRSVYGPISSWEDTLRIESPQALGEHDVLLTCERLAVADMNPAAQGAEALEFQATGNASIIGHWFSGTGERLSYSRTKDQLILEGDDRNAAFLTFQKHLGARPVELRVGTVLFHPGSKEFSLQRFHSFEVQDVEQFQQPRGTASAHGSAIPAPRPQ